MAFVVVVFFFVLFFCISFKRLPCTSFKTTCGGVNIFFFVKVKDHSPFKMAFVVVGFFFTFPLNNCLVPHSRQRVGDMASDRTQRFHIRTAKQVVDGTLG